MPRWPEACRRLIEAATGTFRSSAIWSTSAPLAGWSDCAAHPERDATDLMRYADLLLFAAKRGESEPVRRF